jgi:general stress protein 26
MPIELTDEMAENIDSARLRGKSCTLATASADGWPGIGYRGSMMVFDKQHLAYWERSRRDGLAHIQENPKVTVLYRDNVTKVGWKFYGRTSIHEGDEVMDQVWERVLDVEKGADPDKKGLAVLIEVDYVETFSGQKLQERDG